MQADSILPVYAPRWELHGLLIGVVSVFASRSGAPACVSKAGAALAVVAGGALRSCQIDARARANSAAVCGTAGYRLIALLQAAARRALLARQSIIIIMALDLQPTGARDGCVRCVAGGLARSGRMLQQAAGSPGAPTCVDPP